jgi:MFS family permease
VGVLLDTTPLRVSRDFRALWIGQAVSGLGSAMTMTALPYQVFEETHSTIAVGALGFVQLVPLVAGALASGALADSMDKRRLLLVISIVGLLSTGGLALNATLEQPRVWLLYLLGACTAGATGATYPVLRSLLALLLGPELRPAGYALTQTYGSFGMMVGPAVAGILIEQIGYEGTFGIDAATYLLAGIAFSLIATSPPAVDAARASLGSLREGLRFLRGQPIVLGIFGIDLIAMVFGMPRALLPAFSQELGGGSELYGFMLASIAVGMFLAALSSGWTGKVRRQGVAVLWAVTIWGAAIAVAGLSGAVAVVLVMFAIAGGADAISAVFRSTMAAAATPDELRGRVSGVEIATYAGGPQLGDLESGLVGGLVGVTFAIVSGGLVCIIGAAAFAVWFRRFTAYTVDA